MLSVLTAYITGEKNLVLDYYCHSSVLHLVLIPSPQDVASECEVKCMPTFQFFKKGQKVGISDLEEN